jgi:hypothetical protein
MSEQQPSQSTETYEKSGAAAGTWILVGIVVLSIILGFLAHYKLRSSADVVSKAQGQFSRQGKTLKLHECVKTALEWNKKRCQGLKILCQASIPRVTGACLEAQKRVQSCNALDMGKSSSHFAYRYCKPFGYKKRADQKACVLAYNTVYSYCSHLRGKTAKKFKPAPRVRKASTGTKANSAPPARTRTQTPPRRTP